MNDASGVLWRRLRYFLTPQLDLYKHIAKRVSGDAIEIGFGTGFGTLQYAHRCQSVVAIEPDETSVEFARDCLPLANVEWLVGDVTERLPEKHFDFAIMIEVLEHIPDYEAALNVLKACLKDYGTAIISGPNANASLRKNDKHEREWTAKEFSDTLKEYFSEVVLYDYRMAEVQDENSTITPLVAVCKK